MEKLISHDLMFKLLVYMPCNQSVGYMCSDGATVGQKGAIAPLFFFKY
jgi:hypothetical protein